MNKNDTLSFLLRSTLSNYGLLMVRMVIMIFMTRMLFLGLPQESYGFWALLWSVFGYSLLLDFGFGTAIQKSTSETLETKDFQNLNQILSSSFAMYSLMGGLILIFTLMAAYHLNSLFNFSNPAELHHYQTLFLLFGTGTALIFPFGFFGEVLRGLQAIEVRNKILMTSQISQFILIWACLEFQWGLMGLTLVSLSMNLGTNLVMAYCVHTKMPELKISFRMVSIKKLRSLASFSFFAYIIMMTNLIIFRTDQMVISSCLSVSLVGGYQIVSRFSDLFRQFSTQIHDGLGPVVARLFTHNEKSKSIKEILLFSHRIVLMIALFLFVPIFNHLEPLLKLWLNLTNSEVITAGLILLISMFIQVTLKSTSVQVLLMCEKEKTLMSLALFESIGNLFLSVGLCLFTPLGIIGVALGTLIPNVLLAFFAYIPMTCKFANISVWSFIKSLLTPMFTLLSSLSLSILLRTVCPLGVIGLMISGTGALTITGSLCFLLGTSTQEKKWAVKTMKRKLCTLFSLSKNRLESV